MTIELASYQAFRVPAPQECLDVLNLARQAGIAVAELYTLRAPLLPHSLGGFIHDRR